ncbi:MAG: hypothetical protein NT121_02685 [Chloroflexi bacterium]|nr:hypothetical protein [Chloroflexota bacterium]
MANEIDFDDSAQKTSESNNTREDYDNLYGHVFALPESHFIARGQLPDLNPYIAANAQVAGGKYMIKAFTDTNRLTHFARKNNLMEKNPAGIEQVSLLSMPT